MSGIDCFPKFTNLIIKFNDFPSDKLIKDIYQFISTSGKFREKSPKSF